MVIILRNKRGISPILSTILLLTASVVAMLIVIAYSHNFIVITNAQMGERLCVEKVLFNATHIKIYVRNIGHGDLILENIIINETFYDLSPPITLPTPGVIPEVEIITISYDTLDGDGGKGVYSISFFTSRNNELGYTEVEYS